MREASSRLFTVACKGCGRVLVTVERLRDPEIDTLVNHLHACAASEALGDTPTLGEIMRHLRAASVERTY